MASPQALRPANASDGEAAFDSAIRTIDADLMNAATHMLRDASVRQQYARSIKAMADELRASAKSGRITWGQAAEQAQAARDEIMQVIRARSTAVGRAMAERLKQEGPTLNALVGKYTRKLYGDAAIYERLAPAQRNRVFAAIVSASGRSRPRVTIAMARLSRAGRGLVVLSIALSVYTIATADDKVGAAKREGAVTLAGIGGGMAGGAIAGLACGPGAPVCVGVGAFVGGALAAFGVDFFW